MPVKHKIILTYTKDLSVEIPDAQTLLLARERISKYKLNLDISSKIVKDKMIEEGHTHAQKFNDETIAINLMKIYSSL